MRHLPLLLLAASLIGCDSPAPEGFDYHSGPSDGAGFDTWEVRTDGSRFLETRPTDGAKLDTPEAPDVSPADVPGETVELEHFRDCTISLSVYLPAESGVAVATEFTDWDGGELAMEDPDGDGTWELTLDAAGIQPGSWGYKFHTASDKWLLDPANPLAKWVDGIENSKLVVPNCAVPELVLEELTINVQAGTAEITVRVLDAPDSEGVKTDTAAVLVNGTAANDAFDAEQGLFVVQLAELTPGTKISARFSISNDAGPAVDLWVPFWTDQDWEWRDGVLYFAFTDRFNNGDPDNDEPAGCAGDDLANWRGGDWKGITEKIEAGYFDDLGVDVLWISPPYDNPDGCFTGEVEGKLYTAYHGYFPLAMTGTESRYGSLEDLRALTAAAHARGIRVIADLVANHLHDEAPLYEQHKDDGWFHEFTPCAPAWDKPIECWFQPYMPDLDHTNDAVVEAVTDSAIWWAMEADLDGFRVDAVKHMVHNFARTLRHKLDNRLGATDLPFYLVGETFMGDWGGGQGEAETVIKEFVNEQELHGQFDFPLYWQLLRSIGRDEGDFAGLGLFLTESDGYYGADALMCSFIGNHDVPRFLSHAAGDIEDQWGNGSKEQGWYGPPGQPDEPAPYQRAGLAFGLMMTLPEIPLIYYGDEIGLAGAGDPDNRREMPWEGWNAHQESLKAFVETLGQLRRALAPLRRGSLTVLLAEPDLLVFQRSYQNETVIIAANRAWTETTTTIPLGDLSNEPTLTDQITGDTITGEVTIPPQGLVILTP